MSKDEPVGGPVNHPKHYNSHPARCTCGAQIECITIIRHYGFNLGNAIKYLWRADYKGSAIEDLKKSLWYIQDEIAFREGRYRPEYEPGKSKGVLVSSEVPDNNIYPKCNHCRGGSPESFDAPGLTKVYFFPDGGEKMSVLRCDICGEEGIPFKDDVKL